MKKYIYILFMLGIVFFFSRCEEEFPFKPEFEEQYSGGTGTIFNASSSAFSFPDSRLNEEDGLFFFTGNSLFSQNWISAPASTTARDGVGPLFNARSCSSCHFKDGRGRPPEFDGESSHGLLLRLATGNNAHSGPIPDPIYGGQLQDLSILSLDKEGDFNITYNEMAGTYPDGTPYTLRKPIYNIIGLNEGVLTATEISPRVANQVIGLGLLEAISENTLLDFADENDADGDGISGKANYVWNIETQSTTIGRFGWKANQPNVRQQVAAAFSGDMGITSSLFPNENCPPSVNCDTIANGGSPEIPDENLGKVTLYSSSLAVPGRRDWEDEDVLTGKALFNQAKCNSCHIPKITTGTHQRFNGFSNQTIRPYTDLLLHDMGEDLADNSSDFLATGQEWRTPPLWGVGLFEIVNRHTFYLHDGRARNLEEAILWHGGEAENSKNAFMDMSSNEREQVIKFLNSL